MRSLIVVVLLILVSCGKGSSGSKTYAAQKPQDFDKFINQKALTAPNLNLDKAIINNDYPIEIALYKDQRFYYNLPNLGDGTGTWEFKDGFLRLKAKRTLFDMQIDVHGRDEKIENLSIKFTDRWGPNTIPVTNENMN